MFYFGFEANCKLLFQLSSHVASKDDAALHQSDIDKFFSDNVCVCEEELDENDIPDDAEECEKSVCDGLRIEAWDQEMKNETCLCFDEDDEPIDSSEEGN